MVAAGTKPNLAKLTLALGAQLSIDLVSASKVASPCQPSEPRSIVTGVSPFAIPRAYFGSEYLVPPDLRPSAHLYGQKEVDMERTNWLSGCLVVFLGAAWIGCASATEAPSHGVSTQPQAVSAAATEKDGGGKGAGEACSSGTLGDGTTCKSSSEWLTDAKNACAAQNATLADFAPFEPCGQNDSYQYAKYECCDNVGGGQCFLIVVGDENTCTSAGELDLEANGACQAKGATLTELDYGTSCGQKEFQAAKGVCCVANETPLSMPPSK
jgi:hypothetical protein